VNKAISGSSKSTSSSASGGGHKAVVFFAWFFAFETAGLSSYVYFHIKKIKTPTWAPSNTKAELKHEESI